MFVQVAKSRKFHDRLMRLNNNRLLACDHLVWLALGGQTVQNVRAPPTCVGSQRERNASRMVILSLTYNCSVFMCLFISWLVNVCLFVCVCLCVFVCVWKNRVSCGQFGLVLLLSSQRNQNPLINPLSTLHLWGRGAFRIVLHSLSLFLSLSLSLSLSLTLSPSLSLSLSLRLSLSLSSLPSLSFLPLIVFHKPMFERIRTSVCVVVR